MGEALRSRRAARAGADAAPALRVDSPARGADRRRAAGRARLFRRCRTSGAWTFVSLPGRAIPVWRDAVARLSAPAPAGRAYDRDPARRTRARGRRDREAARRGNRLGRNRVTMAEPTLAGVRVLDFTWVVAGPVATRILADNGAEVIKLERKVPGVMGPRRVGLQGDLNRNKRSVAINMGVPRGIDLARQLAAKSDLVVDNFSARVMRSWQM